MSTNPKEPADLAARATALLGLVACQEGAVVSRTLVQKPAGSVTLFAFAKGQALSEHTAPYDALVHVLEGQATIRIAGRDHALQAGDAIVMPAHQPHAVQAPAAFKMLLVMIKS